ncbi:UNVERIFIED_ORG: hypothetical protein GGD48_004947 [Rhizobium etli]
MTRWSPTGSTRCSDVASIVAVVAMKYVRERDKTKAADPQLQADIWKSGRFAVDKALQVSPLTIMAFGTTRSGNNIQA